MIFEALQAQFGDSLLLLVPDGAAKRLMVIDGGPGTVFKDTLAPRLQKFGSAPLTIDALMVSHIDADHITGVIGLLSAVQNAKIANAKPPYRVGQLIFNSFDQLAQATSEEVNGNKGVLSSLSGTSAVRLANHAAQEVLASVAQGSQITDLVGALKIPLNPSAVPPGAPLFVDQAKAAFKFGEAEFLIIGPRKQELDDLRKSWDEWRQKKDKTALKSLADYSDKSVPNLSSIVALATWKGKTVLLTGDARGDYTIKGLEEAGILPKGGKLAKPLDILKLPHHGSNRDVDLDFFQRLPARHYVASGNGWYGNPDRSTLEMIETARAGQHDYTLHLTYTVDQMDQQCAKYLAQQTKPRPFDPKKDSTAAVIQRLVDAGVTVRFGPVRIDLTKE